MPLSDSRSCELNPEIIEAFAAEAAEHLEMMEFLLPQIVDWSTPVPLKECHRAAHTLKGAGGLVGLPEVTEAARSLEAILGRLILTEEPVTAHAVEQLSKSCDRLRDLVNGSVSERLSALSVRPGSESAARIPADTRLGYVDSMTVQRSKKSASPASTATMGFVDMLIVDDSRTVRNVLTNLARKVGWRTRDASDGMQALEILERGNAPDVMLVDLEMPRMGGYEVLIALRGRAELKSCAVVVMTARVGPSYRQRAFDLGSDDFLVKPFLDEKLIQVVVDHVGSFLLDTCRQSAVSEADLFLKGEQRK